MPSRNERAYDVINKDYILKDFKVSTISTGMVTQDSCLSSFMILLVMSIKRTILKIAVIEN